MRVVNHQRWPLALEDGTILAAAGTNGSTKEIASLSDRDFRHVGAGRIAIVVEDDQPASPEGLSAEDRYEKRILPQTYAEVAAEVAAFTDEEPAGNVEVGKPETKPRPRGGRTNG